MSPEPVAGGTFLFTASSFTVTTGPLGTLQLQANFEGVCGGLGFTLGTMHLSRLGERVGEWNSCTVSFPEGGDMLTGQAQGQVIGLAPNRWRTQGVLRLPDHRRFRVEGEIALDARSWRGHLQLRT